jgi:DNA-binding GntR family transcriptional regulator
MARVNGATRGDAGAGTGPEQVYQVLRKDLLNGRMAPGERLKVVELSIRFEWSQSVVREALARLAENGLVVATPQRGFRVRELSVQDIQELTEARVQIESMTLGFAIARGDIQWESAVLASHHLLENTPVALDDGQFNQDWRERHQAFHRALLSGCGNAHLEAVSADLRDCAELYRRPYWSLTDDSERDVGTEHRVLKELTLARETDAAVALLRAHIERAPLKLVAYLAEHGTPVIEQLSPCLRDGHRPRRHIDVATSREAPYRVPRSGWGGI